MNEFRYPKLGTPVYVVQKEEFDYKLPDNVYNCKTAIYLDVVSTQKLRRHNGEYAYRITSIKIYKRPFNKYHLAKYGRLVFDTEEDAVTKAKQLANQLQS